MVPMPDKLIKMLIKTRALSHLGLPAETGFSLSKSHWGRGWVDEGDARVTTEDFVPILLRSFPRGCRGQTESQEMEKQQKTRGGEITQEFHQGSSLTPEHQFPREITVYQPRKQAE